MHRQRSIERLRASISSALSLCSQLESGRQQFAHRVRDIRTDCDDVHQELNSIREDDRSRRDRCQKQPSSVRNKRQKQSSERRQIRQETFQPRQDFCKEHYQGRKIPRCVAEPYKSAPQSLSRHPQSSYDHGEQYLNDNSNYGSLTTRPCPFSPTRTCPRVGPCPYSKNAFLESQNGAESSMRLCPYSPTNYCGRSGPCPYMLQAMEEPICPITVQMKAGLKNPDVMNQQSSISTSPQGNICSRCRTRSTSRAFSPCYSPTVCPYDPRPCVMSPRECPFKPSEIPVPSGQYATACPLMHNRLRSQSEPRCPYGYR